MAVALFKILDDIKNHIFAVVYYSEINNAINSTSLQYISLNLFFYIIGRVTINAVVLVFIL